jgi:hypothetical protein
MIERDGDVPALAQLQAADRTDAIFGIVALFGDAGLCLGTQALEILAQDEVDDTGNRVGSPLCRCTARDHFSPFDQQCRDLIEIDLIGADPGYDLWHEPVSIDQHERARRAKTTQIGEIGAGERRAHAGRGRRLRRLERGNFVEHGRDVGRAACFERLGADDGGGGWRGEAVALHAAGGHDDFVGGLCVSLAGLRILLCRSDRREGEAQRDGGGRRSAAHESADRMR